MPAGSEVPRAVPVPAPELPHTWRPLGVRIAVWVFGGMLFAMFVAVWFAIGADSRAEFTTFQRGTLVLMLVLLLGTWNGLSRSRVTATTDGLTVVNGYRRRFYEWSQVINASLRRGAPWGTLDLSDGTTVSMIGVQGSDGKRARKAIRELRATIAAHTPHPGAS